MSDMSAAAWASPGGILAGARDLGSAFMGYPVQLAAVRQQREQQEWERTFRGDAAARDAQAQAQRLKIQNADAVRQGLLPPSDLPAAFQGIDPEMLATGRAVQDTPYLTQGEAAMTGGQPAGVMPTEYQMPAPTHQERLASEGAADRGRKAEYMDAQTQAMLRGPREAVLNPRQRELAERQALENVALSLGIPVPKRSSMADFLPAEQQQYEQQIAALAADPRVQQAMQSRGFWGADPAAAAMTGGAPAPAQNTAGAFGAYAQPAPAGPMPPGPSAGMQQAMQGEEQELQSRLARLPAEWQATFAQIMATGTPEQQAEAKRVLMTLE